MTYPNDIWKCPITGVVVPKDIGRNLEWRERVLALCEERGDEAMRRRRWVRHVCAKSPIVCFNLLFWTYLLNEVQADGSETAARQNWRPFVTWPVQDEAILSLSDSIENRKPIMFWKSREMGASWLVLGEFARRLLFVGGQFLVMSRALELVESSDDPDSLFWKLRKLLSPEWIPKWLLSGIVDRKANIHNKATEGTITGRSTTSSTGAGGRRDGVMLDEFAHVDGAKKLDSVLTDTAKCKIYVSTPIEGSWFNKLRFEKRIHCVELPWWRSPFKTEGLRYQKDEDDKWELVSNWERHQKATRTPWDYAENVAMSPMGSSEGYFPQGMLAKYQTKYCRQPVAHGDIEFNREMSPKDVSDALRKRIWETTRWHPRSAREAKWKLWVDLKEDQFGRPRPPQDRLYVVGADLAKGTGATPTAIAVYDAGSGEKVAEYLDAHIIPTDAARLMVAVCYWFGGVMNPYLIWEQNGPGLEVGLEIMQMKYPRVYFMQVLTQANMPKTQRPGYHNRGNNRKVLYSNYREMLLAKETIKNLSRDAVAECSQYVVMDNGDIVAATVRNEKTNARDSHADMATADAMCAWVLENQSKLAPKVIERYSPEDRLAEIRAREAADKAKKEQDRWSVEY